MQNDIVRSDKMRSDNMRSELAIRQTAIRAAARRAFTLIELLLVLVILAILAGIVVPKFTGQALQAKIKAAKAEISTIKTALDTYEVDNGRYPTTEEGLGLLVPAKLEKMPVDPWGNPYVYRVPGTNGKSYDLFSMGPDGHEGGGDDVEP